MNKFTNLILILVALVSLSACASSPKARAVQLVVASDGVADEVATQWDDAAHARIDKCRAEGHETPEAREKCMGVFATVKDELEAALETLVAAQLAVKLAVECEHNPLKLPQEALAECGTSKQADWKALEAQVMDAWDAIRPLFQEIRKAKQ